MSESVLIFLNSMDSILEVKVFIMTHLDLQKTFPDKPCVSQILGGPSMQLGIPTKRLSIPPGIR